MTTHPGIEIGVGAPRTPNWVDVSTRGSAAPAPIWVPGRFPQQRHTSTAPAGHPHHLRADNKTTPQPP